MILKSLPADLDEPYYYLSSEQTEVLNAFLPDVVNSLPCWVPHRWIVTGLGFSTAGIDTAMRHTDGRPYVWATEFENVHSTWNFTE